MICFVADSRNAGVKRFGREWWGCVREQYSARSASHHISRLNCRDGSAPISSLCSASRSYSYSSYEVGAYGTGGYAEYVASEIECDWPGGTRASSYEGGSRCELSAMKTGST